MSGGLGRRLRPLTETIPKPLLPVGGKPVIVRLIECLSQQGFNKIYVSINYLGEMIKDCLGNGKDFGVNINYLAETIPLGTAGCLSLLNPAEITEPVVVMNADIITHEDFCRPLTQFKENNRVAAMGIKEHFYTLPYGCVKVEDNLITHLQEKPTFTYLINAGAYIISPEILHLVPSNIPFDMVDLFNKLIDMRRPVGFFKMYETWIDIGQMEDLDRARSTIA